MAKNSIVDGTRSLALEGQSSCATQEAAGRERGRWHKKFGPLGPKFLCHPRGSMEGERGRWHKKFGPRAKVRVPPKREQEGQGRI